MFAFFILTSLLLLLNCSDYIATRVSWVTFAMCGEIHSNAGANGRVRENVNVYAGQPVREHVDVRVSPDLDFDGRRQQPSARMNRRKAFA